MLVRGTAPPEEAAAVRTLDDSSETSTNLTIAVIVLAVAVVLLIGAGTVYFILRRMKPKAKVAPAPPAPEAQMNDPEMQRWDEASQLLLSAFSKRETASLSSSPLPLHATSASDQPLFPPFPFA